VVVVVVIAFVEEQSLLMFFESLKKNISVFLITYPCFSGELSTHFMTPSFSVSDKPIQTLFVVNEDMNLWVNKNRNKCDSSHSLTETSPSHKLTCLSSVLIMTRSAPRSLQYCLLSDQLFSSVDTKKQPEPHRNTFQSYTRMIQQRIWSNLV